MIHYRPAMPEQSRPHRSIAARSYAGALAIVVLAVGAALGATPTQASAPDKGVPVNGKWGGFRSNAVCMRLPAEDLTPQGLPTGTCASENIQIDDEDVMFTLRNRHITSLAFDISLQCRASDVPDWTPLTMTYRTSSEFSYAGLDGTTQIPVGGRLRIAFPIEHSTCVSDQNRESSIAVQLLGR